MTSFTKKQIEQISRILGELTKGYQITEMFNDLDFYDYDSDPENTNRKFSTKWRRINKAMNDEISTSSIDTPLFQTIEYLLNPINFVDNPDGFDLAVRDLNKYLKFSGYELLESGKIKKAMKATTIKEALSRKKTLLKKLEPFNIHDIPLTYCKEELLTENYFHAVFEASKSVFERIRSMNFSKNDGIKLIDETFNFSNPSVLIENSFLQTQTEKNEYNSLITMCKTIHFTYRNPQAHIPKIFNPTNENDALLAFLLISKIHLLLDKCKVIRYLE